MKQKEKEKETKGEKDKEKEKKKETKIEKEKEKETTYGRDTKINFLRNCGPFLFFCLQSVFVFACKKTTKKKWGRASPRRSRIGAFPRRSANLLKIQFSSAGGLPQTFFF